VGNSAAFISLPQFDTNYQNTISRIGSQNIAQYLPTVYESALLAGYQAQRNVLMQSYASWQNALLEFPFNGGPGGSLVSQKPLSRGTVALQPSNIYAEPNVDYHVMVRYVRRWFATPAHQVLTPREISPGASITTDDQIKTSTRNGMTASIAHSCCTSAMMPRDQGGVVGPDLLVYGVTGLSVADGSIMPLIPATHLCQTTYALAEKVSSPSIPLWNQRILIRQMLQAADIIKSRA
jgi:choline dehydrogenase-like flavoprotein